MNEMASDTTPPAGEASTGSLEDVSRTLKEQ